MASTLPWELLHTLLGVLREGSLSGAARLLGLTQPTVGRHIAALEAALGQVLFTRSPTGLLPTEAALALRGHAEQMETAAAALQRAATSRGDAVSGTVRVTASEVRYWIASSVAPPLPTRKRASGPLKAMVMPSASSRV